MNLVSWIAKIDSVLCRNLHYYSGFLSLYSTATQKKLHWALALA